MGLRYDQFFFYIEHFQPFNQAEYIEFLMLFDGFFWMVENYFFFLFKHFSFNIDNEEKK